MCKLACEFESYTCHNRSTIDKAGNGNHFTKTISLEKVRVLSLVSATLEVKNAMQTQLVGFELILAKAGI